MAALIVAIGTLVTASARSAVGKATLVARPPLSPPTYRTR
jgi:hypothetical protein